MLSKSVKEKALALGLDAVGIVPIEELKYEGELLKKWLSNHYNGSMQYMENNIEKRINPALLVDGAKSIIVTLLSYYNDADNDIVDTKNPLIARYSRGKDYHLVVKDKLFRLFAFMKENDESLSGRCFTDSAPVMEHAWAVRAGLGWIGKNTLLINKGLGSYCFIGVIISSAEFDSYNISTPKSYCGTCTRCIDACPTKALSEYSVNANLCISYNTIENKGEYPESLKKKAGNRIFGCDVCQDVCPWNQNLSSHDLSEFKLKNFLVDMTKEKWLSMSDSEFNSLFRDSPLKRAGLLQIKRNILRD